MIASSPYHLHHKRILVTGASSGIGREVAIQCARMGATVILTGRDHTRLAETASLMQAGDHLSLVADLTQLDAIKTLVKQAGAIDGVVHCAAIDGVIPARMISKAFLDRVLETNFHAPVLLTQQLLAQKTLQDGGSIVFMTSIAAHTGTVGVGPYSASKTAILGLMRCLALEVAKRGIRVNAISPGMVDTPLVNEDRDWLEEKVRNYPLGLGQPIDVAHAAVFHLSDASRKITGTAFHIDGGVPYT